MHNRIVFDYESISAHLLAIHEFFIPYNMPIEIIKIPTKMMQLSLWKPMLAG